MLGGIDDDEVVAGVRITAGTLVWPRHIFERQLVEAELAPQQRDVFRAGVADVEPQPIGSIGEQLTQPSNAHCRGASVVASIDDKLHGSHGAVLGNDASHVRRAAAACADASTRRM
jgi:hypothetical protein